MEINLDLTPSSKAWLYKNLQCHFGLTVRTVQFSGKMRKVPTQFVSEEVIVLRTLSMRTKAIAMFSLAFAMTALQGCMHIQTVEPWQKGNLAKPEMTFDADPLEHSFKEHIYSSKEGSSGGSGVGGGGCGCN